MGTVYKVVVDVGTGVKSSINGSLLYHTEKNRWTQASYTSKLNCMFILAFDSVGNARNFAKPYADVVEIWSAQANVAVYQKIVLRSGHKQEYLERWWDAYHEGEFYRILHAPKGTLACRQIQLLYKIYDTASLGSYDLNYSII